jgi:hypothetical protein
VAGGRAAADAILTCPGEAAQAYRRALASAFGRFQAAVALGTLTVR